MARTKRSFRSSHYSPIVKYGLRGRGWGDGSDLLQRTHSETRERKATLARLVPYGCKGSSPSPHPDLISYLKNRANQHACAFLTCLP